MGLEEVTEEEKPDVQDFFVNDEENKEKQKIKNFMENPDFFKPITAKPDKSPADVLLMILKYSLSGALNLKRIVDLLMLVNQIFSEDILPETIYFLNENFNCKQSVEFHAVCPECSNYLGKIESFSASRVCELCKSTVNLSSPSFNHFFLIIDPTESIKNIINRYDEYYDDTVSNRKYKNGQFSDIYDGIKYREFVNNLPDYLKKAYESCIFNTDGAEPYDSSNASVWPIYLMINEIPVVARFRNLAVCGLWFGKGKTNLSAFLKPFVDLFIDKMSNKGVDCCIRGQTRNIKIYGLTCCVDTPARSPSQGTEHFMGKYGCSWCTIPGEKIDVRRYTSKSKEFPYADRDEKETKKEMEEVANSGKKTKTGVVSASPLRNLLFFSIVWGFVPDYMHNSLLGVGKYITDKILYMMTPTTIEKMDQAMSNIEVPHQLARPTRSINERKLWKAKEWESFLFYYSLPLFKIFAAPGIAEYWALFINSIYTLSKTNVSYEEAKECGANLLEFVMKTEKIFSIYAMTINIHQLTHLATSVMYWGPLWAHSCFPFETANRFILKAIHSANGVCLQILRYLNMSHFTLELERRLAVSCPESILNYCNELSHRTLNRSYSIKENLYFSSTSLSNEEYALIYDFYSKQIQTSKNTGSITLKENINACTKMVRNDCLYSAKTIRQTRTNNSFARLKDKRIVRLLKFITNSETLEEHTICNLVNICNDDVTNLSCYMQKITNIENEAKIVRTSDIETICVYVKIDDNAYVSAIPNPYSLYA